MYGEVCIESEYAEKEGVFVYFDDHDRRIMGETANGHELITRTIVRSSGNRTQTSFVLCSTNVKRGLGRIVYLTSCNPPRRKSLARLERTNQRF